MTPKKLYYGLVGVIVVLGIGIFGSAYAINSLLVKQSNTLLGLKTKLAGLNQEQTELAAAKKDIKTYSDLYNISKVVVPQSKDQTQTVRQIVSLAKANDVVLQSISFPASTLGGSGTTTTTPSGKTVPAAPQSAASAALSQLTPVPTIPGVYDLQLIVASSTTIGSYATYPELINFLHDLEQNRLTALVSAITIDPQTNSDGTISKTNNQLSFTLTLDVYIKPGSSK